MEFNAQEEYALLNPGKTGNQGTGYDGQDLKFKRASRGTDEDQDLTESEYLVKTMQEVS